MNIAVCIKQVPDTEEERLRLNGSGTALERDGVPQAMNDFDGYALEAAARLKDADPSVNIIVVTAGPEQAKAVLKNGLSIAADKAYHVCDGAAAGSDLFATARVIAAALRHIAETEGGIDAVFLGKQSIDGKTGGMAAALSEELDMPMLTNCLSVECAGGRFRARREIKGGAENYSLTLPCVLSFAKPEYPVRYSNIKRKLAANRAVIPQLGLADIGVEPAAAGHAASRTHILSASPVVRDKQCVMVREETAEDAAAKLAGLLRGEHII